MNANSMRVHLRHWRVLRFESCFCFALRSGRAGGDCRWPGQRGLRGDGPASSSVRQHPVEDVLEQAVEVAAMPDDGDAQFLPQRMGRDNAEIATDIGDDRTDRPAADFLSDLLRRGEKGKTRVGLPGGPGGGWLGRAWCTLRRRTGGSGWCSRPGRQRHDPGFERVGEQQAAGDASEDQADVACTERPRDGGEVGGGAPLQGGGELLAVIDELAHDVEDAAEPADGGYDWDGGR